jgi:glycosyltransferase involved in cell wall biosynthesis
MPANIRALPTEVQAQEEQLAFNHGKRIGILIVAYNAVTTLSQVLKRIPAAVWDNVEQVAVFDDASQDATYELAVGLKALNESTKLHVLKQTKNLGYGGNQKAGYKYFIEQGFDVVVMLHGDGQYAPEVLARMYHGIVTGKCDAIFGSRMMKDFGGPLKGGMPLYKYLGNRVLTHFENRALGLHLSEFHSGYRAYNLHSLAQIDFSQMTDDFHFDTEIIVKLHHQGFKIHEVPIPTFYGDEICYVNGMRYAKDILRAVYRYDRARRSIKCYPEYREYYQPYRIKTESHSSHAYSRLAVGSGQDVLEVALGDASFGAELEKAGNRVTYAGPVSSEGPAAASGVHSVIQTDPSRGLAPVVHQTGPGRFDKILMLDVLEHFAEPERALRDAALLLKPNGSIVVSIPNVANLTVRLMLLFGLFEYHDRGIMDRSHLRFFTRRTARRLIESCGFDVSKRRMTIVPVEVLLGGPKIVVQLLRGLLIVLTALAPGLLGYQTFLTAQRKQQ